MSADNENEENCADSRSKDEGHVVTACNAGDRGDYYKNVADSADKDIDC